MSLIGQISPTNVLAQKAAFLADPSSNPVFTYQSSFDTSQLTKWGHTKSYLVDFALQTLKQKATLHISRSPIDPTIVEQRCRQVLSEVGVTEEINIIFDPHKATRCSVSGSTIIFHDPPEYASDEEFIGGLNHELQTHLLRNLNQAKQGWHLDREKFDDKIVRTEEGLAGLHAMLANPEPLLWRPAAYYVAVDLGSRLSFSQTFAALTELGFDEDFAWKLCLRVKRGLSDTSQPGGNTKDICYLEGVVQMWHWLSDTNNDPRDLYLGKIFVEELATKKQNVTTTDVYIPTFMKDINQYRQNIKSVGHRNQIDSIPQENV